MSKSEIVRSADAYIKMRHVIGPHASDRDGLDDLSLDQVLQQCHVPGASVAVIDQFEIDWAKCFGTSDVVTGTPTKLNTLFQAASISKAVCGMALVKAAEQGMLDLDADINLFLRSWKAASDYADHHNPVTARTLAGHVAGLADGFGFGGYLPGAPLPTVRQILDGEPPSNTGPVFFDRPPLRSMKYSGGGSTILQLALMDVYGEPFHDIVSRAVLNPIGMTDTNFSLPLAAEDDARAARGHGQNGESMSAKYMLHPELYAAGMWSTACDLAKFAVDVQKSVAGLGGNVLSRAAVREMLNPVGIGDYAIGFSLRRDGDGWYFAHSGGNQGFISYLIAHKARGYGVVAMTNGACGMRFINELVRRVSKIYQWDSNASP